MEGGEWRGMNGNEGGRGGREWTKCDAEGRRGARKEHRRKQNVPITAKSLI